MNLKKELDDAKSWCDILLDEAELYDTPVFWSMFTVHLAWVMFLQEKIK